MAGSSIGTIFRVTTWGESHGVGIGVVIDGCPAGIPLCEVDIQTQLDRRKPGQSAFTTQRKEDDRVEILSGVFEGRTTGTPIALEIRNKDHHSADYSQIASCYRPGHADYTFDAKYGFRDYRGGGRSSGRETAARVAAGAVAEKMLASLGIDIYAYSEEIAGIAADPANFDRSEIERNPLRMPDAKAAEAASDLLSREFQGSDSAGGIARCIVTGLPAGLGDTVFEKLDANLAKAILSIGAVKGFEIGDGFAAARSKGSINNDAFLPGETGPDGTPILHKATNHSGGVLGGMSDGDTLTFRAAFKPTPSIYLPQQTVRSDGTATEIQIKGRHDPLVVPRAIVVVEAMTALTLADALLLNMSARMDRVKEFYHKN